MSRSRYVITEADKSHFFTCTVVEWLPLFTRPGCVDIALNSWRHLQQNEAFKLYGYVVLENHLHFVAQAPRLDKCISSFKSFTAKQLLRFLEEQNASRLLDRLRFACRRTSMTGSINFGRKARMHSWCLAK